MEIDKQQGGAPIEARHWIDGEWVGSARTGESVNPATGRPIGIYHDGGAEEAARAVAAAARAFRDPSWTADPQRRAVALMRLADAYEARRDDIVDTLCRENGKLRYEAGFEAGLIVRGLRFAAGLALQNFGRVMDPYPGFQGMSIVQPIGVAGLIVPWNSPAYLSVRSLAPALAAGCTAVVKMPMQAAQTAALMSEIIGSVAELPRGAVNVFIESGADGARHLVEAPEVQTVSFTGSTRTGRAIGVAAAERLKRVGLELGGKTPHLIFDDADLDALLPVLEKSSTVFAGQFCMCGSRILVQRGIAERVREGLAARLRAVRPGPAADPASDMGPLIDRASLARIDAMVEAALAAGAKAIVRGGIVTEPPLAEGNFYRPALLEISDASIAIAQQEVFGPVQTLQVFDTEDEAIALANDSEYGLSACVWSRDVDRPVRVSRRLEAGFISINGWANIAVEFEEGGYKSSGLGRLGGVASLEDFVERKQITQTYAASA
ncbi:aldehyde dehydrogenase family protein [Burkholderia sp. 22PA0099]|uniref:aldehyde dehydrogenase family protein n=1 Tax=Burkholderia sp. 22PA0099 TaxID=3237372 RepID=UPI0039C0D6A1